MSVIKAEDVIRFFRLYFKVDEELVQEWVEERNAKTNISDIRLEIDEDDLYEFNDWCRWKGTAYEAGIDDNTKIGRLLEEIRDLKDKIDTLETENKILLDQLEILPY